MSTSAYSKVMGIPWGTAWNRAIQDMPVPMYCDWVLAKRPGFKPASTKTLFQWIDRWKHIERARSHDPGGA